MRKIYTLIMSAAMMLCASVAKAIDFTLPDDNPVLQSDTYHMRLFKTWNFISLTVNDNPITPTTFNTGAENTSLPKCDGYTPVAVTNDGMEGWYMGIGNIEFNSSKGLNNNKANGIRYVIYTGLKKGQIVCIQNGAANEKIQEPNDVKIHDYAVNCNRVQKQSDDGTVPAWTASYLSNNNSYDVVEEITDEIHAIQNEGVEEGEESLADAYRYFRVIEDGPLYIAMGKAASIQGMQIWIDANAEETVSTPSMTLTKVDHNSRDITFKNGESSFGSECTTWWGVLEMGENALFLKQTDEIDHYDEVYETDEETGEKVLVSSTPVYKYVLDPLEGTVYGDRMYDGELANLNASDDEDGDGKITIAAATVSSTGGFSEIVTFDLDISEITLNTPELILTGFNEQERNYRLEWTNNTICKEDYQIIVEGDNGEILDVLEQNTGIGNTYSFKENAKVTVKVEGYNDGVLDIPEVDLKGVSVNRKYKEVAEAGKHDYDFVHLSDYQKALIKQDYTLDNSIIESCYLLDGEEKVEYTAEEFIEGVSKTGVDLSGATPVIKESGWDAFDTGKGRTAMKVIEGGVDTNSDGYGYLGDQASIWGDIIISNPPYKNSAGVWVSSILLYINDDLGLYFGTNPEFTFPRSKATAGEYVSILVGYGSSNSTNSRNIQLYQVPAGELLSFKLGKNPHVFYIDIYSYDNLPADEYDPTAIENVTDGQNHVQKITGYYTVSGKKLQEPQKGINIVSYADGSSMKIFVK